MYHFTTVFALLFQIWLWQSTTVCDVNENFRSVTDVISLVILFFLLFLFGWPPQRSLMLCHFKSDQDKIWQESSSHRLMELDFWLDIIISRRQPWHHFTQKTAAALPPLARKHGSSVCMCVYAAMYTSPWSIVHSYLLLYCIVTQE